MHPDGSRPDLPNMSRFQQAPDVILALESKGAGNGDGLEDVDQAHHNGQTNLGPEVVHGGEHVNGGARQALGNLADHANVVRRLHQAPDVHDGDRDDCNCEGPQSPEQLQLPACNNARLSARVSTCVCQGTLPST